MAHVKPSDTEDALVRMATEIVAGFVRNNPLQTADLPSLIETVHETLADLAGRAFNGGVPRDPAVPPDQSVHENYIVCLEDGVKLKMLKRHLRSKFGLTPAQYRARWNLPADYPMVAPGYAERRSKLAKEIGLGKRPSYRSR